MVDCFFFFKQKTAYDLRISDWSSDVCSSDLDVQDAARPAMVAQVDVAVVDIAGRKKQVARLKRHDAPCTGDRRARGAAHSEDSATGWQTSAARACHPKSGSRGRVMGTASCTQFLGSLRRSGLGMT